MLVAYLILGASVIGVGLMLMVFTYPELYARFGKFLVRAVRNAAGHPEGKPGAMAEAIKPKARKLTPSEVLASRIEQLIPGQTLRFKIPETWGGNFITVELNPQYPNQGRKYILSIENTVQGMPGGEKTVMSDSDQSLEIATSVLDRNGELLVVAEEIPVSTEKVAVDARKEAGLPRK